MENSGMVYSTEFGRMCPSCGMTVSQCRCGTDSPPKTGDGVVRVRREIKGRGGKTVTLIYGLPLNASGLEKLSGEMKRRFGTGGSVKDGAILLQGDRCSDVVEWLAQKGYKVKRAGG